jgi:hypothetical protein
MCQVGETPSSARAPKTDHRKKPPARETRWAFCFSLSQYLDHHPFATLSVELGIESPLPGPQVQPTLGDRQQRLIMDEEGFEVASPLLLRSFLYSPIILTSTRFRRRPSNSP